MNQEEYSAPRPPDDNANKTPKRLASHDLFGSGQRVEIIHGGQVYVLQITRQGKLILTK